MSLWLVYLLLLKATLTSFSGLGSLPTIQADFVEKHHAISERELNRAVAAGRTGPGPIGVYVVNVGYAARGVPGAIMGWLAMITPAFLVIPLMRFVSRHAAHPRVRSAIRCVILASAGLLIWSVAALGGGSVESPLSWALAGISFAVLAGTRVDSAWVLLAAAVVGVVAG